VGFINAFGIVKLGLAALALIVVGYMGVLKYENSSLEDQVAYEKNNNALLNERLNQSAKLANDNAKALIEQTEAFKKQQIAMSKRHNEELKKTKALQIIKERIPHEKDAPIAPVLNATLDGLRKFQSTSNNSN